MALALNRTGEIFKKCDRGNHRPQSNQRCASGTCQHTCESSKVEKCQHAWTLRYWVNGKQLEKSFKDTAHATTGRVSYGSGKKIAQDFQLKLTVGKRADLAVLTQDYLTVPEVGNIESELTIVGGKIVYSTRDSK